MPSHNKNKLYLQTHLYIGVVNYLAQLFMTLETSHEKHKKFSFPWKFAELDLLEQWVDGGTFTAASDSVWCLKDMNEISKPWILQSNCCRFLLKGLHEPLFIQSHYVPLTICYIGNTLAIFYGFEQTRRLFDQVSHVSVIPLAMLAFLVSFEIFVWK